MKKLNHKIVRRFAMAFPADAILYTTIGKYPAIVIICILGSGINIIAIAVEKMHQSTIRLTPNDHTLRIRMRVSPAANRQNVAKAIAI